MFAAVGCGDNRHPNNNVIVDGATEGSDAPIPDAHSVDANPFHDAPIDSPPAVGPFGAAIAIVLVPGMGVDDDPSMTSDLLELYFNRESDIFVAKRTTPSGLFGTPVRILEVSSGSNETGPSISGDGLTLYFASDRPGTLGLNDVWVSTRASRTATWGVPVHLSDLSSSTDDTGIAGTNDDLKAVFASDRLGGDGGLFLSSRASASATWGTPTLISEVHQVPRQNSPMLSDDGLSLTWDVNFGNGGDFYVATRATILDTFGTPTLLSDLSSPTANDNDLWVSADGHHAVFLSDRIAASYSFFEASR